VIFGPGRKFILMNRDRAFTLIEMVIAIFIVLLLLGLAVPSVTGVLADKRLHRSLERFNQLVRLAHERSIAERRAYLIVWGAGDVSLRPAAFLKTEERKPIDTMPIMRGEKWQLELPSALSKKAGPEWIFWESGVCEPARVKFGGSNGSWTARYSPLTALSELTAYAPR
jgi:prepilin-type N-terminal cleavage/methylation domain-containing protein